jgi:hypothetical protein
MLMQLIDRAIAHRHPRKTREEIQTEVEQEHRDIGRGIARRFTRGNVNIKRGAYLTKRDLEKRGQK